MKRSLLVGVGLALITGASYAATQGAVPVPPSVMGLPTLPAPVVVQQAAPVVAQACNVWSSLWPALKENMLGPLAVSGLASVLAMMLPQAQPGTPYGLLRAFIDLVALNMKNAANAPKVP